MNLRFLFAGLFQRERVESEMAQELKFHIESRAADLERAGFASAAAERQARLDFGSVENYKDGCREASGFRFFDELRADLRYAFRTLRNTPGFSAIAVLSIALGIGVNLSCFTSLYSVVLHPFPYPNLDRIVTISGTHAKSRSERDPVAAADFIDFQQASRSFESMAAFEGWDVNLTGVDHPDHIRAALASSEFFRVLGMNPIQGRTFATSECEPGKDAVIVVSHSFWQTRLAAKPDTIGATVSLGGRKYTVIGVMPDEFNLPLAAELWAPLALTPEERSKRGVQPFSVVGRLKAGVSLAQAGSDMDAIARRLEERYPQTNEDRRVLVASLQEVMKTPGNRFILVLTGAAFLVLLLACTNVGSLQVARAMGRQKEIGLRSALGASRFRILRQLLTESLVLGLAGGLLGLALAAWDLGMTRSSIPIMVYRIVPGLRDMGITGEVVIVGILLSLAASVLCCLPAMFQVVRQGSAADLNEVLKEGGRTASASPSRNRLRTALVVAEVALAFILLVGAGLMVGTFQRLLTVNLGYDPNQVLTGDLALSGSEYQKPASIARFCDILLRNLSRLPDVQAVAASGRLGRAQAVSMERRTKPSPGEPRPQIFTVTPQYLQALKIPLLKGRWISDQDGSEAPRVVVLSASVVRHYWPASNPIGERVKLGNSDAPWLTVAGVVGDLNDWFLGNAMPAAYVSYHQFPEASLQILMRTSSDSRNLAGSLRLEVQAIDREQPIYSVRTLQEQIQEETSGVRIAARMMSMYAVIALLLAITGIYSISSFFVAQRTREIGVRMSLGASRQAILKMVLYQSCSMTGIGLLIGLPVAIAMTVGMSHVLYNVVTLQSLTFVLVMAIFGGAAALAGYIPAHRAARVDPMVALRHE